jgi:hypothetical protein
MGYSPDLMKLQGFPITRDNISLLMRNPCSFMGEVMSETFTRYDETTGIDIYANG